MLKDQDGFVLSRHLAVGPLSLEEALSHATSLAYAVRQVHRAGSLCSSSLMPEHIVIGKRGVRLENSGSEPAPVTAYTSPERLRGESPDARSDIFAFGAVFYKMLAGRAAVVGSSPDELRTAILGTQPDPIDGVPDQVQALLTRCLEKERERRWQRMSAVVIELKLAHAVTRQARQAAGWKERMGGLQTQITAAEGRLAAHQSAQEVIFADLRSTIRRLEEKAAEQAGQFVAFEQQLASSGDSVAGLEKVLPIHARAIESLEAAVAQTDEVLEHVVDAFGATERPLVERVQTVALSSNGG
jgi:hypothetical protein